MMERDLDGHRRSPYIGGKCMTSPSSCLSLIHNEREYSRIGHYENNNEESDKRKTRRSASSLSSSSPSSCKRLRRLIRRVLVQECGNLKSKTMIFHYDAVSYSQNFDDGCHLHDDSMHLRCSSHP